jgi:hypothetical protein
VTKFHLWGIFASCWAIWKARNKACFQGKIIKKNPIEIICHAGALMQHWTGLYVEVDRMMLINGGNTMLKMAIELHLSQKSDDEKHKRLKLQDDRKDDDQDA